MWGRSPRQARSPHSLLRDTILPGLRLSLGGPFSASTQTAPSASRETRVLVPPDAKRALSCSLTLLASHLCTLAPAHTPSTCHQQCPVTARLTCAPHRHPRAEGHAQVRPGPGFAHRHHLDSPICHLSCCMDREHPMPAYTQYTQDPRRDRSAPGAPSTARSIHLQPGVQDSGDPICLS